MSGQSILMAKEALSLLLNSLPMDSTFNIVRFGSRMEMLFPSSQPYNDTTLEQARLLVKGLARAGGGTSAFTTEGEQLARKVVGQLRQALAPSLHPVQVDWGLQGGGEHCQ